MKFQAFHVNPGEKLKKKDVNNDLSHFMSVFPTIDRNKIFSLKVSFWTNVSKEIFCLYYFDI